MRRLRRHADSDDPWPCMCARPMRRRQSWVRAAIGCEPWSGNLVEQATVRLVAGLPKAKAWRVCLPGLSTPADCGPGLLPKLSFALIMDGRAEGRATDLMLAWGVCACTGDHPSPSEFRQHVFFASGGGVDTVRRMRIWGKGQRPSRWVKEAAVGWCSLRMSGLVGWCGIHGVYCSRRR